MAFSLCLGIEPCFMVWVTVTLLFFICALFRKWIAEETLGIEWSFFTSVAFALLLFIIIAYATKSIKWSLLVGLMGMLAGGWLGAKFFESGEGGGFE